MCPKTIYRHRTLRFFATFRPELFPFAWIVIFLFSGAPGAASDILVLDPTKPKHSVVGYADIWTKFDHYDPSDERLLGPLYPDIAEVLGAEENGEFEHVESRQIGIGLALAASTVRVAVRNSSPLDQTWILAFNRAADYFYRVYFVEDGKPPPEDPLFEFEWMVDQWDYSDVLIHTEFTIPANASGNLYVVYENLNGALPMTIERPDAYAAKRQRQDLQFFAIVGLVFGLVILTVSLMATLRSFVAIYYAGAVLCGLMVVLLSERYFDALFPNWVEFVTYYGLLPYVGAAGPIFALMFQRQFFADVGGTGKLFSRILLGTIVFCIIGTVLVIETEFIVSVEIFVASLSLCICLVVVNGFIALFKGYVGKVPFFVGSVVYAAAFIIKILSYEFSSLISAREASLILLYAIAIEAMSLAATMFAQVRWIRAEKDRALQDSLRNVNEKLAMADALGHAAHDIRAPLASMKMAMGGGNSEASEDFGKAIGYLEDIVQKQLVEAKNRSADPYPANLNDGAEADLDTGFDLSVVLSSMSVMFQEEAGAKGIDLCIVPSSKRAEGSAYVIMRILSNIVSNAVRNTETGRVLVGVRKRQDRIFLDVYDTGSGMSAEKLEELQMPYRRDGNYKGSGLGLGIVHQLCRENDLELEIASQPGLGSHFRLILATTD